MNITVKSAARPDALRGELRRYLNKNWKPDCPQGAGKWLFGATKDRLMPDGFNWIWTEDESLALADQGDLAAMLGLGSGDFTSFSHGGGAALTKWDSILTQVPGGALAAGFLCRKSNKRKGGVYSVVRSDGASVELRCFF